MTRTGTDGEWDALKEEIKPKSKAFHPQHNRVLVEILPPEAKTQGGIHLPETSSAVVNIGRVIETGPGVFRDGILVPVLAKYDESGKLVPGIKTGDLVHLNCVLQEIMVASGKKMLVPNYLILPVIDGMECALMDEKDILCRID